MDSDAAASEPLLMLHLADDALCSITEVPAKQ
jgi:hypothetical protein